MRAVIFLLILAASALPSSALLAGGEENKPADEGAAQNAEKLKVDGCAGCHMNDGMKPAVFKSDGLYHSMSIDKKRFENSVHVKKGEQKCEDCHAGGFDVFPHEEPTTATCFDCHDDHKAKFEEIKKLADKSVHMVSLLVKFNCEVCHSPHYIKPADEMTIAEKNESCVFCHTGKYSRAGKTDLKELHSWHPMASLHLDKMTCIACHTQPIKGASPFAYKHLVLKKDKASRACEDCHTPEGKMINYLNDLGEGEKVKSGIDPKQMAQRYYIIGATRNEFIDKGGVALIILTALAMGGHGLLRIVFSKKGKKASK